MENTKRGQMQEIYIFIDDSGVLHLNSDSKYFLYSGYIFLSKEDKNSAKKSILKLKKTLKIK